MNAPATTLCPHCGDPLDSESLGGLCARCIALDFFSPADAVAPPDGAQTEFQLGDYQLHEEVARGGMGVVYRARQLSLGREVAVKTIGSGLLASDEAIMRFKAEAAAAAQLRHPHIVAIHEIGEEDGLHFFSMEYVAGQSLAALLRDGPLPARRAAELMEKLAGAVAYAHERGIVHRDLKPSNVLLDARGEPRVTDFGLAKRLDSTLDLTLSGQVLGTPGYLAPEQALTGSRDAAPAVDIYGLGAIFYHMLTGRAPFVGEHALAVLRQLEKGDPPSPRVLNPSVPPELQAVALKCLAREPQRRYASAMEVADELRRWLDGRPVLAKPAGRLEKGARWVRRNPAPATTIAAVFLLLASVAAVSTISARRLASARASEASERKRAEERGKELRRMLYATGLRATQQLYEEGALANVAAWVDAQTPRGGEEDLRTFEWRVLRAWTRGDQESVVKLSPPKEAGALAACGRFASSWDADAERTTLYDLRTASIVAEWPDGAREFGNRRHVTATPDARYVAATSLNGVRLWDTAARELRMLAEWPAQAAEFSPDGRWLAVSAYAPRGEAHPNGVVFFETGNWDKAGAVPGRIPGFTWQGAMLLVLDHATAQLMWWSPGVPEPDRTVALAARPSLWATPCFSADGKRVALAVHSEQMVVFDTSSGAAVAEYPGIFSVISLPVLSPDGRRLARGGAEEEIRLYDIEAPVTAPQVLRGHRSRLHSLRFTNDGARIVSWSADGTLRTWPRDRADASGAVPAKGRWAAKVPPVVSPDGLWIALTDDADGTNFQSPAHCKIWERAMRRTIAECAVLPLGGTPNGRELIGLREGRWIAWHDTTTGAELRRQPLPDIIHAKLPRISADGRYAACWPRSDAGFILDLATGERAFDFTPGTPHAEFSPDGKLVAMTTARMGLRVLDLGTWRERQPIPTTPFELAWSADSRRIAFTYRSNPPTIAVANVATMQIEGTLTGQGLPNLNLCFSRDGRTLVSHTRDGRLRFWNLLTWSRTLALPPQGQILSYAFTPDDEALIVGRAAGYSMVEAPHTVPATP